MFRALSTATRRMQEDYSILAAEQVSMLAHSPRLATV